MSNTLPISNLVNVSVNLSPSLASFPNLSTLLVLGTSTVIDVVTRLRTYTSLTQVGNAFGTTAPEYLAAEEWFEQSPAPTTLAIGRWANVASSGQLIGGPVSPTNQLIATWDAISTGSMRVTVDNGVETLSGLDFTGASTLQGVASVINLQMTGAVMVYDSVNNRFVITSNSTGTGSTVSFVSATGSGTDISGMLAMQNVTGNGAYVANGIAAETALQAVVVMDNRFASQWYGLFIIGASDPDHMAVAAYIEGDQSVAPHFYGVNTQEGGVLVSTDTSDIAYALQQLGYTHSAVQYSSSSFYAAVSMLARILTTNWTANNSTITLMYKQEPGIVAENLSATQMASLLAKNCNVFVAYSNDTAIIQPGITPSGQFIDSVIGMDWLRGAIQTNLFNLLFGTTTKIPQTDAGNHILATGIEAACVQGVANGLLAPGIWNAGGFGQLQQGDFLAKGYYVYTPPISNQAQASRAARQSVAFQVAAKLGGAVHTATVVVNVNA